MAKARCKAAWGATGGIRHLGQLMHLVLESTQAQRRHTTRSRQQQLILLETKDRLTSTFCDAVSAFAEAGHQAHFGILQSQLLLSGACDMTALPQHICLPLSLELP